MQKWSFWMFNRNCCTRILCTLCGNRFGMVLYAVHASVHLHDPWPMGQAMHRAAFIHELFDGLHGLNSTNNWVSLCPVVCVCVALSVFNTNSQNSCGQENDHFLNWQANALCVTRSISGPFWMCQQQRDGGSGTMATLHSNTGSDCFYLNGLNRFPQSEYNSNNYTIEITHIKHQMCVPVSACLCASVCVRFSINHTNRVHCNYLCWAADKIGPKIVSSQRPVSCR